MYKHFAMRICNFASWLRRKEKTFTCCHHLPLLKKSSNVLTLSSEVRAGSEDLLRFGFIIGGKYCCVGSRDTFSRGNFGNFNESSTTLFLLRCPCSIAWSCEDVSLLPSKIVSGSGSDSFPASFRGLVSSYANTTRAVFLTTFVPSLEAEYSVKFSLLISHRTSWHLKQSLHLWHQPSKPMRGSSAMQILWPHLRQETRSKAGSVKLKCQEEETLKYCAIYQWILNEGKISPKFFFKERKEDDKTRRFWVFVKHMSTENRFSYQWYMRLSALS